MNTISKYGSSQSVYPSDKPTYFNIDNLGIVIKQRRGTDNGAGWDVVALDTDAARHLLEFLQVNLRS